MRTRPTSHELHGLSEAQDHGFSQRESPLRWAVSPGALLPLVEMPAPADRAPSTRLIGGHVPVTEPFLNPLIAR